MNGVHKTLYSTQAFVVSVVVLGYIGLTFYSLFRWNETVSAALITGFVIFAQTTCKGFFDWLHTQQPVMNGGESQTRTVETRSTVTPPSQPPEGTP